MNVSGSLTDQPGTPHCLYDFSFVYINFEHSALTSSNKQFRIAFGQKAHTPQLLEFSMPKECSTNVYFTHHTLLTSSAIV
jgi:hypothetical protein